MENVLKENDEIRGFIDKNGILIKVATLNLGEDSVEIIAESILKYLEKATLPLNDTRIRRRESSKRVYQQYLVEHYNYIYIHLYYSPNRVEIKEMVGPSNPNLVSNFQRKRVMELCKGHVIVEELPKFLEKKK
ncbi:MAG: hypothetical protein HFH08_04080 [Bacilli bacterium]|nr:hypothetical protein [Bacilli bacterium]